VFFSVSFVFSVDPLFFIRVDSWFPIRVIRSFLFRIGCQDRVCSDSFAHLNAEVRA